MRACEPNDLYGAWPSGEGPAHGHAHTSGVGQSARGAPGQLALSQHLLAAPGERADEHEGQIEQGNG